MTGLTDLESMLSTLEPIVRAGEFIYVTVADEVAAGFPCEATVREGEGMTVVLRREDADGPALGRNLFHIEDAHADLLEQLYDGPQGEERAVFVIDIVELVAEKQVGKILHFENKDALGVEEQFRAFHKVDEVVH